MRLLLFFYDCMLILLVPVYLLLLVAKRKFYRDVFKRFGGIDHTTLEAIRGKHIIWVHAVSLGEVMTCSKLVSELVATYPNHTILLSTITRTGKIAAERIAQSSARVISLVMPFDMSFLIETLFADINPQLLILLETELWPNMLYYAHMIRIPVLVMNARLSDRSFTRYQFFKRVFYELSKDIKMFCVQSKQEQERFSALGVSKERIAITGNMKFDVIDELTQEQGDYVKDLRRVLSLDHNDIFIVAGSTHEGEEECVLKAFLQLRTHYPAARLLIAPRHLERLARIEQLVKTFHLTGVRLSQATAIQKEDIVLLDTVGTLRFIYALADIVFIGGSLIDKGGHNILEPAYFAKPIIVGPFMYNFRTMTALFVQHQAIIQVKDCDELRSAIGDLLADRARLETIGQAGKSVITKNQGATTTNLHIIKQFLG